ncbi:hypothetical protein ACOZZ4_004380 [Cronobacter dublinensis]|nr:hypothetical protein [Cronobacter dublinensis]
MKYFKGTPGPYTAHVSSAQWYGFENKFFEVADKDGVIIAFVKDWDGAGDLPKNDARLLAAAPDLLGALQLILSYHEDGNCQLHKEDVALARAAIAKAIGEEE